MREIKFRAKAENNGDWVYGYYVQQDNQDHFIYFNTGDDVRKSIDPATLGQYTGRKDRNGKEIYEGDNEEASECEVIGNICENPELKP